MPRPGSRTGRDPHRNHPRRHLVIRLRHKLLVRLFRLSDQVVLMLAALGIIHLRPGLEDRANPVGDRLLEATLLPEDTVGMLVLALGWIGIFDAVVRYRADRLVALHTQLKSLLKASVAAAFWLMVVTTVFSVRSFTIANVLLFLATVTAAGIVSRLLLRVVLLSARRSGYNYRFLLVIGANQRSRAVAERIENSPELGYKITGFVAETPEASGSWPAGGSESWKLLGTLDNLRDILAAERVDEIIVCLPVDADLSGITAVVSHARDLGMVVRLMPEFRNGVLPRHLHVEEFDGECVVTLFREQMLVQLCLKRLLDAVLSFTALVALLPLLALVAVLIKLTSPGPVLFAQQRVGMHQRRFKLYKFRSMVADAEARRPQLAHLNEVDGPVFKIRNDPRVTRLGRFLRRTSIDELPQLFNVLCGEMSLVGPRPPLPEEVGKYEWPFRKRLAVKPGLTCIWQVSGRNEVSFERWMQMDHEYVENWSLWLDVKILAKTIPAVLLSRGAS